MANKALVTVAIIAAAMGCRTQAQTNTPPPATAQVSAGSTGQPMQNQPVQNQPVQNQVVAQPNQGVVQNQGVVSNFGTVTLYPGFTPDPHVVEGVSGGQDNATARDRRCRGWISGMPDHILRLEGTFQYLAVMAAAAQDTTIVIQRPDGTYACNDDAEGRNPMVTGRFNGGSYPVWIGSYQQGVRANYRLGVTELRNVRPSRLGVVTGTPTPTTPIATGGPNYGTITLSPGFSPDPAVRSGVSGGQTNANQLGGNCRGWISTRPDHIFQATGSFGLLRILARANTDTTLVVQDQNGRFWCDDDGGQNQNPMVQAAFPAGTYRVWVGSYRQGDTSRYSIGFSELRSVGTMSLPAP
ncbi:MAG: hypothetical protein AAGF12_27825 [Myxococcota bacterium]